MDEEQKERIEGMTVMDGYEDCIVGICNRFGQEPIIAYDYEKIIQRHIDDGMTEDEAREYFDYNQIGAWVGDDTPCFIELFQGKEVNNGT
jgi:hypothetical protein|tara:strand:+ start:6330 stop:6599 length:270 start_codon:yes stop_codon:yes gene_type:complete